MDNITHRHVTTVLYRAQNRPETDKSPVARRFFVLGQINKRWPVFIFYKYNGQLLHYMLKIDKIIPVFYNAKRSEYLELIHKLAMNLDQLAPDNNGAGKMDESKVV